MSTDKAEYRFLTAQGAELNCRLGVNDQLQTELALFGNRAGLLSFANVLLWFVAHGWRREFLSLAELPFVQVDAPLALCIRLMDADATGRDGLLARTDHGDQYEWAVPEDDLRRVGLMIHRLAMKPRHEYDRLNLATGSAAEIHIRMTDAAQWI